MDELNPTVREQEIYEEMELTPEMIKSIRTLCATCLRHFVEAKAFKIALVPSADKSMDVCTDPARSRLRCHAPLMRVLHSNHRGGDSYRINKTAFIF